MKKLSLCLLTGLLVLSSSTFALSSSDWASLSDEQKLERLEMDGDYSFSLDLDKGSLGHVVSSWQNRRFVVEAATSKYLATLQSAKTDLYLEIEDYHYAQVGPLQKSADVLLSSDGRFLGATIHYWQQGCSFEIEEDEQESYFSTIEEANQAGCFDNDVSWSGTSFIKENFEELGHTGYMEWSGH